MRLAATCGIAALLAGFPAAAHSLDTQVQGDGHVIVVFRYLGGAPMAGVAARVFAPPLSTSGNSDTPAWTGASDADGRVAFTADRDGAWRVDLVAEDGHVDRSVVRVENGLPATSGPTLPRWLLAISLTGNVVTFLLVAAPRLRGIALRRSRRAPLQQRTTP